MKIAKKQDFNKLHLILYLTLTLKPLWIFTKNVLQAQQVEASKALKTEGKLESADDIFPENMITDEIKN